MRLRLHRNDLDTTNIVRIKLVQNIIEITKHSTMNSLCRHVVREFGFNLVPRVSHLTASSGKMRDPGNEVGSVCLDHAIPTGEERVQFCI